MTERDVAMLRKIAAVVQMTNLVPDNEVDEMVWFLQNQVRVITKRTQECNYDCKPCIDRPACDEYHGL